MITYLSATSNSTMQNSLVLFETISKFFSFVHLASYQDAFSGLRIQQNSCDAFDQAGGTRKNVARKRKISNLLLISKWIFSIIKQSTRKVVRQLANEQLQISFLARKSLTLRTFNTRNVHFSSGQEQNAGQQETVVSVSRPIRASQYPSSMRH